MNKRSIKRKAQKKVKSLAYLDKKTPIWKPLIFILPAILVIQFFTLAPFIITADNALHPLSNDADASSRSALGFSEFVAVFRDVYFRQSLFNSIIYAFIAIPGSIIISLIIAATISNIIRKRIRGTWQTIFFLPYVTSGVAISLAFAYLFNNDTGLINKALGIDVNWLENSTPGSTTALWAIIIHGIWSSLAFQVLIFTTAMLGVSKDRYKASAIDGAGPVKQFFAITLPSIGKTLSFVITVGLIGAIKVFPLALFQLDVDKSRIYGGSTLMLFIFRNVAIGNYQRAGASAIILVAIAILFNAIVNNTFKGVSKLVVKGGEWSVQRKIKNKF